MLVCIRKNWLFKPQRNDATDKPRRSCKEGTEENPQGSVKAGWARAEWDLRQTEQAWDGRRLGCHSQSRAWRGGSEGAWTNIGPCRSITGAELGHSYSPDVIRHFVHPNPQSSQALYEALVPIIRYLEGEEGAT